MVLILRQKTRAGGRDRLQGEDGKLPFKHVKVNVHPNRDVEQALRICDSGPPSRVEATGRNLGMGFHGIEMVFQNHRNW